MRPGLSMPCGSNAAFTPRRSAASGAGCGSKTGTAARRRRRRAPAWRGRRQRRATSRAHLGRRHRRPCAARPARPPSRRSASTAGRRGGNRSTSRGAGGGGTETRHTGRSLPPAKGSTVAHLRARARCERRLSAAVDAPEGGGSAAARPPQPRGDRGPKPSSRSAVTARRRQRAVEHAAGDVRAGARRPRPRTGRSWRAPWRLARPHVGQAEQQQAWPRSSAPGSTLRVTSVSTASVPQEPAISLEQVVAGDVLDHLAAGLEHLAAAGDGVEAEEMVARRAGPDAPRAGEVGSEHAAEVARAGAPPSSGPSVRRLEGEHLAVLGEQRSISASGVPARAVSTSSSGS